MDSGRTVSLTLNVRTLIGTRPRSSDGIRRWTMVSKTGINMYSRKHLKYTAPNMEACTSLNKSSLITNSQFNSQFNSSFLQSLKVILQFRHTIIRFSLSNSRLSKSSISKCPSKPTDIRSSHSKLSISRFSPNSNSCRMASIAVEMTSLQAPLMFFKIM